MNGRPSSITANTAGVGVVPRAVQIEFEREEKKIQQFETTNKKFYKDVKYYIDKLDDLIKSENKMINNIANLAQTSLIGSDVSTMPSPTKASIESMAASVAAATATDSFSIDELNREFLDKLIKCRDELLGEHVRSAEAFKTTSIQSVVEPMKNLNSIFPQIYQCIKRRDAALKELLKQQDKLDKLQDKERTGPNLVRINELNLSVNQLKQQFHKEHLFLMEELPKLYSSRIEYIKPCMNTLIGSQAKFYQEYSQFYESILNDADNNGSSPQVQHLPVSQAPPAPPPQSSFSSSSSSSSSESSNRATAPEATAAVLDYVNIGSSPIDTATEAEVENLNSEIQQCLKEIKSLSIVASD